MPDLKSQSGVISILWDLPTSPYTHCSPPQSLMAEPSPTPFSGSVRAFQGRANPEHTGPGPLCQKNHHSHFFSWERHMRTLLESLKMTSICPWHTSTVFYSEDAPFFTFLYLTNQDVSLQSMVCHHSLIRIFFPIFRGPENHNASCNWWHLRVHEIWDINTEIQDINTEMDMQGEARD